MSPSLLPIESFAELSREDHQHAVRLYDAEINQLLAGLAHTADAGAPTPAREAGLDQVCRCINLRKVHLVRLLEMLSEEAEAPATLQAAA